MNIGLIIGIYEKLVVPDSKMRSSLILIGLKTKKMAPVIQTNFESDFGLMFFHHLS